MDNLGFTYNEKAFTANRSHLLVVSNTKVCTVALTLDSASNCYTAISVYATMGI